MIIFHAENEHRPAMVHLMKIALCLPEIAVTECHHMINCRSLSISLSWIIQ